MLARSGTAIRRPRPTRNLLVAAALAVLACAAPHNGPAFAAGRDALSAVKPGSDLDSLFVKLKQATDAAAAAATSHAIEERWARSGSDTADLLMQRADRAIASGDRGLAIEILDRIIVLNPDWAEAWNRQATAFYLEEDLAKAVADIEQVLAREPRHFGALMGLAGILERVGDEKAALRAYEDVLAIYPLLPGAQKAVDRLKAKYGAVPI